MNKFTFGKFILLAVLLFGTRQMVVAQTIFFQQDYESDNVAPDWITNLDGRFTPIVAVDDDGNHYLTSDAATLSNNGCVLLGPVINTLGVANVTAEFDLRLGNTNDYLPEFSVLDAEGNALLNMKSKANNKNTVWVVNGDTEVDIPGTGYVKNSVVSSRNWYHFVLIWREGATFLSITNESGEAIYEKALVTNLSNRGGISRMTFATGRRLAQFAIDNVVVREVTDADLEGFSFTTVTVNYVDTEGQAIRASEHFGSVVGVNATASSLLAGDFTDIYGQKWIYESGNDPILVTARAQLNVITLVYHRARTFSYSVKNSLDQEITSGTGLEHDVVSFFYPQYVFQDGILLQSKRNAYPDGYYKGSFALEEDGQTVVVAYDEAQVENVKYFSEAEDIRNAYSYSGNNADIRCSNGTGALFKADMPFVTLPAGTYQITLQAWGTADVVYAILANGDTLCSFNGKALYAQKVEVTLDETATLSIAKTEHAKLPIDLIYITSLDDVEATPIHTMTYFAQNYEDAGVEADWTTSVENRHTPIISTDEDENSYLCANPTQDSNNGAVLSSPVISTQGVANVTARFRMRLSNTNNEVPHFSVLDAEGKDLFTLRAKAINNNTIWVVNGDDEINIPETQYLKNTVVSDRPWYTFQVTWQDGKTYLSIVDEEGSDVFKLSPVSNLSSVGGISQMTWATGRSFAKFAIDDVEVRDIRKTDFAGYVPTTYTVFYLDQQGNVLRNDVVMPTSVGATLAAAPSVSSDFIDANGQKWIYVSGNDAITMEADASRNIFVLVFRPADTFAYRVTSSLGTLIAEGTALENDVVNFFYPRYERVGFSLYEAARQQASNDYYRGEMLMNEDKEMEIAYDWAVDNVVFYAEAENLAGAVVVDGGTNARRASNGAAAYFTEDTELASLAPGKYRVWGAVVGNASTVYTLKTAEGVAWEFTSEDLTNGTAAEFIITKRTTLLLAPAGSNTRQLDYLYITGQSSVPTGISDAEISDDDHAVYSLQGIQVKKAVKGIYIRNGQKVVVK